VSVWSGAGGVKVAGTILDCSEVGERWGLAGLQLAVIALDFSVSTADSQGLQTQQIQHQPCYFSHAKLTASLALQEYQHQVLVGH